MQRSEIYWLWLLLKRLNSRKTIELLKYFGGIEGVYRAEKKELSSAIRLTPKELGALLDKDLSTAEAELMMCDTCGISILPYSHPSYPALLRNLSDAPLLFYTMGDWSLLEKSPKLTMVGTRKCDAYGIELSFKYARELASVGMVIISGMAVGIDANSHAGALSVRGKTIAVLGCGIDMDYPKENLELKKEIAEKGLILSEFPLGTEAYKHNFPFRNRVLAALSDGVLVVQGGKNSGSLITAHCAVDQGKEVFAIPGPVDNLLSRGVNELIRDGEAHMAMSPMDIVSILGYPRKEKPPVVPELAMRREEKAEEEVLFVAEKPKRAMSSMEQKIFDALEKECDSDYLSRMTGFAVGQLNSMLTLMEMNDLVEKLPGNRYRRK